MMMAGLSLDQAPPYSVPQKFFLTAPIFGALAGLILAFTGSDFYLTRWDAAVIAAVHCLTLGFASMVMIGALQQMLPVVAGAVIKKAAPLSIIIHISWTAGTLSLISGFLNNSQFLMKLSTYLLSIGGTFFIAAIGISLIKPKVRNASVVAMRLAMVSLLFNITLGLTLIAGYVGWMPMMRGSHTEYHMSFGLMGWMGLLIIGVSYQVVPMFQITKPYPSTMRRFLAPTIFFLLLSKMIIGAAGMFLTIPPFIALSTNISICVLFLAFVITTINLQRQRKRKVFDIAVAHFSFGMTALGICAILWGWNSLAPYEHSYQFTEFAIGILFIFGFVVSIIQGMLYKIMPFLVWFHLQAAETIRAKDGRSKLDYRAPNMRQTISPLNAKRQLYTHIASVICLLTMPFAHDIAVRTSGMLLALSFLFLLVNLFQADRKYRHGIEILAAPN